MAKSKAKNRQDEYFRLSRKGATVKNKFTGEVKKLSDFARGYNRAKAEDLLNKRYAYKKKMDKTEKKKINSSTKKVYPSDNESVYLYFDSEMVGARALIKPFKNRKDANKYLDDYLKKHPGAIPHDYIITSDKLPVGRNIKGLVYDDKYS